MVRHRRVRPLALRLAGATAVATLFVGATVAGHDGEHPILMSLWDQFAMLGLTTYGALYLRGQRAGHGAAAWRTAAFWIGWLTMLAAVLPPIDRLAASLFAVHMLQHELMMLVGVPLMVAGRPIATCLRGLTGRSRSTAVRAIQRGWTAQAWAVLTTPVLAWVLHGLAIWIWHAPRLYEAAVRNEAIHALQHATFVGTAALFWWGLLQGRYGRSGYGAGVFYVFTTLVHTGLLGAVFVLLPEPLYGVYAERALDPLGDQQLAGLIMWVPAGLIFTATGLALFAAWMGEAARRARATEPGSGISR